jgi:drug/metabolite transporter (DMT)-like permease
LLRPLKAQYALLTLTSLLWAINWVVARAIRHDSGPNSMALGRWVTALVLILPLAWPHLKRDWPVIRANLGVLMLLSITGAGAYNAISYEGVAHTTAVNAMLLNATVPFFIMGISWLVLRERMRVGQVAGLAVSFIGALWIIVAGDLSHLATLSFNRGDLIVCVAMLSWAIYTIIVKMRPIAIHVTSFVTVLAVGAVITLLPLAAWELTTRSVRFSPLVLGAYLYMGIGPSVLCYLFWNRGVAALGPNRTGMFLYLVPVFGSVLSALTLGEAPEPYHAVGFLLVLAGLGLSNWRRT